MRVVIDTNVFVSALFFGGTPRKVYDLIGVGIIPCFTKDTLDELQGVITDAKFKEERSRLPFPVEDFLTDLRSGGVVVEPPTFAARVSADPSDDMFLACALTANVDYIISGDKHLLDLKNFAGIPVLTPQQFLRRLA